MFWKSVSISLMLMLFMQGVYALPQPVGICGRVQVNGVYPNNITVLIKNMDTGEEKEVETQKTQTGEDGWYVTALSANDGDIIRILYEEYTNTTVVHLEYTTQYLNLSVNISNDNGYNDEEDNEDEEDNNDNNPPPPPSYPPIADFTYLPSHPQLNETVTFISVSTDPDNDIVNYTWTIEQNIYFGENCEHTFKTAGEYPVVLVVTDSLNHIAIAQKTVTIVPQNQTNDQTNQTDQTDQTNQTNQTNVTVSILIKDEYNNTLSDAQVLVYDSNSTLVQEVYTNESGVASIEIPQGSYHIKANYNGQTKTKTLTFANDGRVTFMFNQPTPQPPQPTPPSHPFNPLILILIIIPLLITIVFVINKIRKPWWKRW